MVWHEFVSTQPDDVDETSISPTDWNEVHTVELPYEIILENGGSVLATGIYADIVLPNRPGAITGWELYADQSGNLVTDLWKDTYANFPPTVADTITAAAKPTLSSALKNQSTTLTGWTTAFAAKDVLRVNIDVAATITRATLVLWVVTT